MNLNKITTNETMQSLIDDKKKHRKTKGTNVIIVGLARSPNPTTIPEKNHHLRVCRSKAMIRISNERSDMNIPSVVANNLVSKKIKGAYNTAIETAVKAYADGKNLFDI